MSPPTWILAAGLLLIGGVLSGKSSARIGVPSLLVFLGLGMLAGSDGIKFDDVELARDFGVVSLAFILFSGGLGTRFRDIRPVLAPGLALASAGVAITAALLGWVATTDGGRFFVRAVPDGKPRPVDAGADIQPFPTMFGGGVWWASDGTVFVATDRGSGQVLHLNPG